MTNAKSIVSVTSSQGANPIPGTVNTITITFNDGDTAVFYVYNGQNGTGSVSTVSGIQADGNGDVPQMTIGSGAPTTSTVGQQNQLYYDIQTSILYVCNGENSGTAGTYDWYGTGVTVDNYLSTSSTNPAQNKVITTKLGTTPLTTTAQNCSDAINEHETDIGNMSLTTTATTLSGAVNELDGDITTINGKIGSVSMPTTAQTLTGAVAELDADMKTYTRPNLLDNWYFVGGGSQQGAGYFPINSKGQTSYPSLSGVECIDRWKGYSGVSVALISSGVQISGTATSTVKPAFIFQLSLKTADIAGKTFTFSCLTASGLITGTGSIPSSPSTYTNYINQITDGVRLSFYLNGSGIWGAEISVYTTGTYTLYAAKLEIGDTQTLAHQVNGAWVLNEVPNYNDELVRCGVYTPTYQKGESVSLAGAILVGTKLSSGVVVCSITLPKAVPSTLTITNTLAVGWVRGNGVGDSSGLSVASVSRSSDNVIQIGVSGSTIATLQAAVVNISSGSISFS